MNRIHLLAAGLLAGLLIATPFDAASEQPAAKKKPDLRGMTTGKAKPADSSKKAVHYKNCMEVRKAGKAPLKRGQPGYGRHLDPDNDGVACD